MSARKRTAESDVATDPSATTSLRERQRQFARAQFLAEGLTLFYEQGYSQTTIEQLAERCGCAKGTIYAHFPGGKDELFRSIYRRIGEEFEERFTAALEECGDDIIACIEAAATILMDVAQDPARGRFFMIEAPALRHVLGDTLGRTGRGIVEALSQRIEAAQRRRATPVHLNARHTSYLVLGLIREMGVRVADGDASPSELHAALEGLLHGVLGGTSKTVPGHQRPV